MEYQIYLKNLFLLGLYLLIFLYVVYYRYQELIRYIYNIKKKNKEKR